MALVKSDMPGIVHDLLGRLHGQIERASSMVAGGVLQAGKLGVRRPDRVLWMVLHPRLSSARQSRYLHAQPGP